LTIVIAVSKFGSLNSATQLTGYKLHMDRSSAWRILGICTGLAVAPLLNGQCTTSNGTGCQCEEAGQTNCDLLPDITISWYALQNYSGGPNEYAQNDASNPGRLRVTGSTPNIGHGALNVRGVDAQGNRWFLCGTDTISINDPNSSQQFQCPNQQQTAKQLILQRVYHKNGAAMTFYERFAGTMTYHPTHGHNHVDDWATFTLRIQTADPDPRNWPIVGEGAKVGFCLMDYYSCANSSANGHCRTSQEYQGGSPLNQTSQFPNYGHGGGSYNCSQISQGISSGYTDVYSESLDGMWINIPPGTCNGNYWIVMEVDPHNNFLEENDGNNWTAVPFTLTQQVPGGGDFAQISADGPTSFCEGGSVQLTASAGTSHLWSTGATTQSITVTTPGDYSCTVTGNCGTDATPVATVEVANTPQPQGTGATIMGSGSAQISATGTDVHWFDQSVGGSEMGSGNIFQTPVINTTTQYWAENRAGVAGLSGNVGKTDNTGGGGNSSVEQYLTFDALAAFTLKSVKVYAQGAGNRTFQVLSNGGGLIAQTTVNVPNGESRVNLDLAVPQGAGMRLYVTSTMRNLYRSNGGVSFPYTIADLVSITGSSAGANYYYYAYDWEVEGQSLDCISQRTQVTATVISGVQVNAKVRLEGPFDAGSGLMRDDLRMAGLVPVEEPYTGMGFSQVAGGGGESTTSAVLAVTGDNAIVDWVRVELRSATTPSSVVATRQGLLQRDGDIVAADGVSPLVFNIGAGTYHVAVRHRNHLGVMTANPLVISGSPVVLDLSSPATATWGTNARKTNGATMLLWAGNAMPDAQIKYTGSGNDRDPILQLVGSATPTATMTGYNAMDITLDGSTKYTGSGNDRDPILVNVGSTFPNAVRGEQIP